MASSDKYGCYVRRLGFKGSCENSDKWKRLFDSLKPDCGKSSASVGIVMILDGDTEGLWKLPI